MSDMAEDFKALNEARKERHKEWNSKNMKVLVESKLPMKTENYGESILFREKGKPKVDFFPSTGRWRVAGVKKTFRGGAKAFLAWYEKQSV